VFPFVSNITKSLVNIKGGGARGGLEGALAPQWEDEILFFGDFGIYSSLKSVF